MSAMEIMVDFTNVFPSGRTDAIATANWPAVPRVGDSIEPGDQHFSEKWYVSEVVWIMNDPVPQVIVSPRPNTALL